MRPLLDLKDAADLISATLISAFQRAELQHRLLSESGDFMERSKPHPLNFGCLYIVSFEPKGGRVVPRQFIPLFGREKNDCNAGVISDSDDHSCQLRARQVEMSNLPQYLSDPFAAIELLTECGSVLFGDTLKSHADADDTAHVATVVSLRYRKNLSNNILSD